MNKHSEEIIRLSEGISLFRSPADTTYCAITINGHKEIYPIKSERFKQYLESRYYARFQLAAPKAGIAEAIIQLNAIALYDSPIEDVFTRIAKVGNSLFLDLCDEHWQAIEINSNGWKLANESSVRFIRKIGMRALPMPAPGFENINPLFDLLHFNDTNLRLLITAWVVNAIIPSNSFPILAITGEQGSGKTTFCRALQRLIDPHTLEGRSPPRSEEDIAVAAQHAHLIMYENLSSLSQSMSDALCRVATGAGFAARKLYTDSDERQLTFVKPMIINGIEDLATRSDLADRIINVNLQTIPKDKRQPEEDIWRKFQEIKPRLIGAILNMASQVLKQPDPEIKLERMAEYSIIGGKVAIALGIDPNEFINAYKANRDNASHITIESSAIGPAILYLLTTYMPERISFMALLKLLQLTPEIYHQNKEFPKTSKALANQLRRLTPNFERIGVNITFHERTKEGLSVSIEKKVPG